ncbi:MAG TPA: iron-containing alcohol dehydrogenase [Planktothrix sp.]|jgi:alcohol dehydrogenase class IV
MNPFVFHCPTKVNFGEHMAATAADSVKDCGAKKTLIVTDAVLLQAGILQPILSGFDEKEYVIFSDVPPDSDVDCVNKGARMAREAGCDCVLAVGGGSVLDTAKVINICMSLGGELLEYQGLNNLDERLGPLIAIPTTAGTGSEVSMVAMVKDNAEGKKLLFGSRFLAPDVAILDPTLLVSLPAKLTAATGLDALTHDIEAYTAVISNSIFTDALCVGSLKLLFEHLPRATNHGDDLEARAATLVASAMAGVAFTNSGVGIVHALAHATGAKFGTHHGLTNSIFLPHGMHFNLDVVSERYASLARHLGFSNSSNSEEAARALISAIEQLSHRVGLPNKLRDLGVPKLNNSQLDELAFLASTDPAIMFNPKESSVEDIIGIYERAY